MTRFEVDEDIRRAWTIPAAAYTDGSVFASVVERVFARSWQYVTTAESVRVPRQAYPFSFLDPVVDEPLVFVRDDADTLRLLSNVCTHRGNLVVETPGSCAHLRCRYHGRRFGLDGCFKHMPEFEDVEGFPAASDDLATLPHVQWGSLLFAAVDPIVSFDDWFGPVRERLDWLDVDTLVFDATRSRDYLVQANWALYCDNYLEGFHIPFVHAGLNEALDYGAYRTELFEWGSLQLGIASGGESVFDLPASSPDHGESIAAYYFWLFPNLMVNVYPWGISLNVVRPLSVGRTKVSFLTFVGDASRLDEGAGAGLDRVEREDEAIVESVQRGVRSRRYDRGRYSPTREQGVHHFHRMLVAALGPGTSTVAE